MSDIEKTIKIITDPKIYFIDQLQTSFLECGLDTELFVKDYLAELLLCKMQSADELSSSEEKTVGTLAELLLLANQTGQSKRKRFKLLKELGDNALYVSGFFGDSLQKKLVDVDYYIDMGSTAYENLSHQVSDDTFSNMYKEIAGKFAELVGALANFSQRTINRGKESNVLRLMDLYSKTGAKSIEGDLTQLGIFPDYLQLKKCKNQ